MKTKIFDKNLYIEGLHQLKKPALVSLITLGINSLIIPMFAVIGTLFDYSYYNFIDLNPFIYVVVYICAPVFTYNVFSFLFKRKSSDFYHSLSIRRTTLFISFSAAIMTMLTAIILACSIIMLVISHRVVILSSIIPAILNLIAGCALMASGITLGCALSGKRFPALATAAIILFMPRIVLSSVINELKIEILAINHDYFDLPFLGNNLNVLTGADYNGYSSVIYSIILALIYFAIGAIVFRRRKSEFAEKTSLGNTAQAIVRIAICMVFCLPATLELFSQSTESSTTYVTLFYFFGAVAYFLFEIITRRTFRTLLKTTLQFVFVILINIALFFGMTVCQSTIEAYQPSASDVDNVRLLVDSDYYKYYNDYASFSDYTEYKNVNALTEIKIVDEEAEKILSTALKDTLSGKIDADYYEVYDDTEDYANSLIIAFEQDGITRYRKVFLTLKQIDTLWKRLATRSEIVSEAKSFPDETKKLYFDIFDFTYIFDEEILLQDKQEVYKIAVDELQDVPISDMLNFYYFCDYGEDSIGYVELTDKKGNSYILPVFEKMTDTVEKYVELSITSTKSNIENLKKGAKVLTNSKYDIYFESVDDYDSYLPNPEKLEELQNYILEEGTKKGENKIVISCYCEYYSDEYNYDDYKYYVHNDYINFYFYIDKDSINDYMILDEDY